MPADLPNLGQIGIGEPDANAEYFSALRTQRIPLFLDAFFATPHLPIDKIIIGDKFLLHGQKGTGKTATLRYIENQIKDKSRAEFLIFKKAFYEEIDLQILSKIPLMVDEEEIKRFKHYHHVLKRVLISILISLSGEGNEHDRDALPAAERTLVSKIKGSRISDVIRLVFDSLGALAHASAIDIRGLTNEAVLIDASKAIKRANDGMLDYLCKLMRRKQGSIRLFIDEIHFAYRSEESLQQDAILVRDCILAVQTLNDRFAEEQIDCIIYAAVRSEYLEHPIISTADINHSVESVGVNVNWSTYALNADHPLFNMLFARFRAGIGDHFTKKEFMNAYFANIEATEFLSRTWNKPRDVIRFFKCAGELFPNRVTLTRSQLNSVWRRYAQDAWNEMKSSASPFLNPAALSMLENTLRKHTPRWFENTPITVREFSEAVKPVYDVARGNNSNFYDFQHFLHLLYILGLFGTRHESGNGEVIFQTYHRGNRSFHMEGQVRIHPTVMKAFG